MDDGGCFIDEEIFRQKDLDEFHVTFDDWMNNGSMEINAQMTVKVVWMKRCSVKTSWMNFRYVRFDNQIRLDM